MAHARTENDDTVLFRKGHEEEDHDNIWDDTALIAAYDKAVGLMKADSGMQNKTSWKANENEGSHSKKHKKKTKSRNVKWKVGDKCDAIYAEDGLWYPAVIKGIKHDVGTGVVEFTGYGNVEEVSLGDVRSPRKFRHRPNFDSELNTQTSETSEPELTNINYSQDSEETSGDRCKHCSGNYPPNQLPYPQNQPAWSGFAQWPPNFNSPWPFTTPPPPSCHHNIPHTFNFPQSSFSNHKMNLPPPQVPLLPPLLFESVDDALASTLMAWYISGYHTGYYQAMKQHSRRHGGHSPRSHR